MASYLSGIVIDQNDIPVSAANVYVFDQTGALAALRDDLAQPIAQPIVTDALGAWDAYFVAATDNYSIEYRYGGRLRARESFSKGDPGGNAMAVGLATSLGGLTIPAGTDLIQTSGYGAVGTGAALYVADATANAGLLAAHPLFVKLTANGRYFRLSPVNGKIAAEHAGTTGDGVADDGPELQAALDYLAAVGGETTVEGSPGKTYATNRPILLNSYQTFRLNGCTLKMLAGFATVSTINAVIGCLAKTDVAVIGPGTIDANAVGLGGGDAARKNGVMIKTSDGFLIDNLTIQNCTGYATYPTQTNRGKISFVKVLNSQYHFEQQGCMDVSVDDCRSGDGAGTIACSGWLHPVFADGLPCKRISYRRFYGSGSTSAGVSIQNGAAALAAQEDIHMEDVNITMTNASGALIIAGANGHKRITAKRCMFKTQGEGLNMASLTDGHFEECTFDGQVTAVSYLASFAAFTDCTVKASHASADVNGFANADNAQVSRIEVVRGLVDLSGGVAGKNPIAGTYVYMSRETRLTGFSEYGFRDIPATTTYAAKPYDQNRTIDLTWDANAQNVEMNVDATTQLPPGSKLWVRASSTGAKTITAPVGVTLKPVSGTASLATLKANGTALLEKSGVAASTWLVSGDLV